VVRCSLYREHQSIDGFKVGHGLATRDL